MSLLGSLHSRPLGPPALATEALQIESTATSRWNFARVVCVFNTANQARDHIIIS
jgi:hypothetical protein